MTKAIEEVAAALRAHRDARKEADANGEAGCLAFIAPKVDITMSTCIGNFTAVIPIEVDDRPGTLMSRYGEEIGFVQHDNPFTTHKATRLSVSQERFRGDGPRTVEALRNVGKDINAFCDAIELVWNGGKVAPKLPSDRLTALEAFVADLAEEAERCRNGARQVSPSYIEKRIAKLPKFGSSK